MVKFEGSNRSMEDFKDPSVCHRNTLDERMILLASTSCQNEIAEDTNVLCCQMLAISKTDKLCCRYVFYEITGDGGQELCSFCSNVWVVKIPTVPAFRLPNGAFAPNVEFSLQTRSICSGDQCSWW